MNPRGMTLLEASVSVVMMAGIMTLVAGLLGSARDATSVVNTATTAQTEAERLVALVREELRGSGISGQANLQVVGRTIVYTRLDRSRPLFDDAAPLTPPWEAQRRVLAFEQDGAEVLGNSADEDRDHLRDEGRLALYVRPAAGPDQLVSVLGNDVADPDAPGLPLAQRRPMFSLDQSGSLPRVTVVVDVERVLQAAVRSSADAATLAGGGGPRSRHRSVSVITLLN